MKKAQKVTIEVGDTSVRLKYKRGSITIPAEMLPVFSQELCLFAGRSVSKRRTFWAKFDKMRKNSTESFRFSKE